MEDTKPNAQSSVPVATIAPVAATPDPKIEQFARRERQLFKQMKELKAREEAITAKEREYQSNYVPKSRLQEDPLAALNELGFDYQKLTEMQLQNPNANDPTIRALMSKLQKMEERFQQQEQQRSTWEEQQVEQGKKQMLMDAQSFTKGKDDFELVDKWGAHDLVVAEIDKEYEKSDIIISMEEASKRVETHLLTETIKALEFNKIKNYKKPVADTIDNPGQTPTENKPYVPKKGIPYRVDAVRTLTNNLGQDVAHKRADSSEDARDRAIRAYNGTKD